MRLKLLSSSTRGLVPHVSRVVAALHRQHLGENERLSAANKGMTRED